MSAQSAIFNPSQTTSAASGDGFSVPRLTTTGRLAISFTTADKGMMVYDTTLNNLFIWTGAAWESVPASGDAGANGSVQYNDNGVISGATNFIYDKATGNVGVGFAPVAGNGAIQLSAGVGFPAVAVPSANANTLDDYEEGTWTPFIKGASTAGTGTYSVQAGTYTKVGRVVYFQGRLTWSAHTGTGDMQIGGIPFTSLSTTDSNSPCNFGYINNLSLSASGVLTGFVFPNTNDVGLYQYPAGGGAAGSVAIDTAADIIFSGTYFV